ncbi:MAG TPA: hypothetical protein DCM05_17830 [Elusimicrobia bacterium]|nr:hypothetical protein [Elusimicrobiota bacterium]
MTKTRLCSSLLIATLCWPCPASAKDGAALEEPFDESYSGELDGRKGPQRSMEGEGASDSEILTAVREAEENSLDSAMERSGRDAQAALEDALALVQDARQQLKASLLDLKPLARRQPVLEDEQDVLLLSDQMLETKAEAFRQGASSASLSVPELDEEALTSRRTGYRPKDRARDLHRAQDVLRKASARYKKAPALDPYENALLDSAAACQAEVRHAAEALRRASGLLLSRGKDLPRPTALKKEGLFSERIERLDEDGEGLRQETAILAVYLKLRRIDEESFDQSH